MEGEKGIAVDIEEFALRWVRAALGVELRAREGSIEAEEVVEPLLNQIALGITNGFGQSDFA